MYSLTIGIKVLNNSSSMKTVLIVLISDTIIVLLVNQGDVYINE